MKDSVDYRIGPGMTSLLMIFFVLCMAALAILTLQSVQVESALNKRTADTTGAYYEATVQLERQLADIDAKLASARADAAGDPEAYAASVAALQAALPQTHATGDEQTVAYAPSLPADALPLSFAVPVGGEEANESIESIESEIQVILHVAKAFAGPRYTVARRMLVNIAPWDAEQDVGLYVPGTDD